MVPFVFNVLQMEILKKTKLCILNYIFVYFKGIVPLEKKKKNLLSFTYPHVISNLYLDLTFFFPAKHRGRCFKECFSCFCP